MKKTSLQELFSKLETEYPKLFNVYSVEGREFINKCHPFLELEKQQIMQAFYKGYDEGYQEGYLYYMSKGNIKKTTPEQYYNKTYKENENL